MTRKRKRGRTREGPPKAAVDPLGVAVTQRSHWARGGRTAARRNRGADARGADRGRPAGPSGLAGDREARNAADKPATEEGTDGGQRLADEGVSLQRHGGRVAKGRGTPHTQAVTPFTQNRAAGTGTGARVARDAHTAAGWTTARDARRTSGPLTSALPRQRAWGAVMAVAPETPQI